jgi:hypothetical protein
MNGQTQTSAQQKPKKSRKKLWIIIGIAVVVIIVIAAGAGKKQQAEHQTPAQTTTTAPAQDVPKSPDYTMTIDQLWAEYDANELAANQKYKGKIILLSGIAGDVGTELLGREYVFVKGAGNLASAQCVMNNNGQAASVVKGQPITVQGSCNGKMGWILLENCEIK